MKSFLIRARFLTTVYSLCLLLSACTAAPEVELAAADESAVIKSPNDTRDYRALVLDNGMKVLLVSDPEADTAAASVDVNAGSNSDPREFSGLAHFLEHMLFLGTAAYPEAGEYQEYIAAHGGSHNAYTAYENTNYYFDVDAAYLEPALDRFSQFFIAPLFTQAYVDRERNAVHSEYQSGLQDDGRRGYSILKAIMNPGHPLAGFSVGSLDTLQDQNGVTLRAALLAHYDRYYSANLMTAALSGPQTLDELEVLARRFFTPVINRERTPPLSTETLFTPGTLPALLALEPVRDSRSLTYTFPIPQMRQYYKSKPLSYLGHILGHEGEGSLLALLRARGWANGLSAGGGFAYTDAATFTVSVVLTEAGVEHVDDISGLLFQFIELTRRHGIEQWIHDELRVMAELAFRYQEQGNPVSYVSSMSRRLQEYPPAELITAAYTYESFEPALLNQVLDALRPDNVLMTFTSRSVEGDRVDPLYGGSYSFVPLSPEHIARWNAVPRETTLAMNVPNPFLPEKLEIKPFAGTPAPANVPSVSVKPEVLLNAGGARLWFKQDNEFLIPRANFSVYALTELFGNNLRNSLLSSFAVSLVNDKLNEYSYPVNLAGAAFGIAHRSRGFTLSVGGYTDKQTELLETLLKTLVDADFSEERFNIIRTEMIRSWQNAELQTPYVRLFQEAQALLISPYWSEEERIAAARAITLDDVKAFVPRMLDNLRIEALYHGNIVEADALQMLDIVTKYLTPSPDAPVPTFGTVVNLPEETRIVQELEIPHDDSAIVIYVQGEDDTLKTRATVNLLATILRTPFYDTLRTEQQLGYIVNASTLPILKTNGLVMYIESPSADPLELEASIDAFLAEYATELAMLDPAVYDATKAGLVTELRQPPQRLNSLSARYWSDILIEEYAEDSTLQMANAIEALSLADIVAWYNARVAAPDAGRLVARSAGRPQQEAYLAARAEPEATLIMDDGNADYVPFKQQAEQFEFSVDNVNKSGVHPLYGFAMALLTAFMWGVLPVVFTLLRGGPDVMAVTWIRFLFSAVVVGLFLWQRNKLPALSEWRRGDWLILFFAVFFLAGNFILYLLGLELISPEATAVVIQLAPFILMFGSVFFYGERFAPIEWFGAAVLFIGLVLFFNDRLAGLMQAFTSESLGILYILFAAVSWGIYGLMQKPLLRKTGSVQLTLLMYGGGALLLLPVSAAPTLLEMTALQSGAVLFGCLNMVVGYGAFTEALRVWQGAKVSAVIALAPVITIICMQLAVLLWPLYFSSSHLNLWAYVGAALVVAGSMLAALGKQRR